MGQRGLQREKEPPFLVSRLHDLRLETGQTKTQRTWLWTLGKCTASLNPDLIPA